MSKTRRFTQFIFSTIIILSMSFSMSQPQPASAQGGDGIQRQVNAETGRVSFIGPESGRAVSAARALGSLAQPADPALALAKRFAPEFGLKNPERDLTEMKANHPGDGRMSVRYQQNYEGIPVMGGELIVNTNENGDLYSMNGEVSADLSLSTEPTINSEQARQTALQAAAKWYQKTPADFLVSEPELWIFDESLLRSSTRPAELVWRMEVTSVDNSLPLRELVLINAQRGNISLHFNQIDTAWHSSESADRVQTSELPALPSSFSNRVTARDIEANQSINNTTHALVLTTWYVATTGNNSNSCSATGSPCLTINGAIGKAANGDMIKIAIGTYTGTGTEVVLINKNITLSGGWNAAFATQSGMSTIDGQAARRGIINSSGVTSIIERFVVQNGYINNGHPGAGIYNLGGTITLNESTITGNDAGHSGLGGGIANLFGGVFIINSSTIHGNRVNSGDGGGIVNFSATLTINNSTISGNTTNHLGGGIYMEGGTLTANNTTIYANSSTYVSSSGGGIYNHPSGGSISIKNTIIAGNTTGSNQGPDCAGSISSLGHNLIGNFSPAACPFTPTTGDIVGYSYDIPIDPLLAPLQNNGGPTLTHALRTGSPAINIGNPTTPGTGGNTCLATDQRGTARPVGNRCDIGAYEGSVTWTWTLAPFVNTYTANNTSTLPGTPLCNQTQINCTNNVIPHADSAHRYAAGTYDLYKNQHNRNGINNSNMAIVSTVHYDVNYENAFWSGTQMVYGDGAGFARADDVVAHEFTHGVTQYESNLFYYYQSGAINESFSDLWGEYYDQTNGLGNDEYGFKWYLGENVVGSGPIRTMIYPGLYGDPDKMTSPNYHQGEDDSGGVHSNSGINNKAVYLMVDGDTFNGITVSALGWVKTVAIYYEVNTNLLISGSDYSDLYYALQQACSNLIGQKGITAADCQEVKDAIDAVEMNSQPTPNFNTDAPLCGPQQIVNTIFFDNLESGTSKWTFTKTGTAPRWQYDSPYGPNAHSGLHSLYADDYPAAVTDASARLIGVVIPNNTYLHFAHAYGFESNASTYYDGGVLEYSNNGGSTWQDAGFLIDYNGYKGTIFTGAGNPLSGRSAFVGDSHGYISTRLNLASLAGQTVTFRWRMGLDEAVSEWGWWVDDVRIFNCKSTISGNAGVGGVTLSYTDGTAKTVTSSGNGNYSFIVSDNWSGTVTPTNTCFNFTPASRNYSNVITNQTGQNYTPTLKPAANCADVDVLIGGSHVGNYGVPPEKSIFDRYKINNGPVKVSSTNALPILTSQRAIFGTSFNSIVGYPADQLTTEYWFTSYDDVGMITYLVIGNPSASTALVDVYIGGVKRNTTSYSIAPGQRIFPRYGINAGPVHVVSTNGVDIFTSERTKFGNSFNEVMGYPGNQLTTDYWFTSYDDVGMITYLVIGNPHATLTAEVDVYIAGVKKNATPYSIAPGQRIFPRYGINAGPVHVVSTNGVAVFTSERSKFGNTFNEVMGYPADQLTTDYWFTSYDDLGMITYLVIGNPHATLTAEVDVYINGIKKNTTPYSIAPGQRVFPRYGINSGPVHVVSTNGVAVFTSERAKYLSSFNEILGLPDNQLTTDYWFTSYDDLGMTTYLIIAAP